MRVCLLRCKYSSQPFGVRGTFVVKVEDLCSGCAAPYPSKIHLDTPRRPSPVRARERSEDSPGRTTTAPKFELKNPSGGAMWTHRSARKAKVPFRSSPN